MKNTFILLLLIFISSCVSLKPKQFQELNHSDIVNNSNSKYSIDIPGNWFAYYEYHNLLAYAPRELKKEIEQQKTNVFYTIYNYSSNTNDLDEILDSYLRKMDTIYNNFTYKIIDANHKAYGKYYIIKHRLKSTKGVSKTAMSALIVKNNMRYRLYYFALDEYFEKYLPDVIKTINSFKIKE